MKKLAALLLISLLISCASKHIATNVGDDSSYMPVIVSGTYKAHNEYDYYYGLKKADTVVFVVAPGIKADRGRRVAYIKYNGLQTTDKLINGQDTLHFVYSLYNEYNKPVATAGSGAPGKMQQTMHAFKSYPYLIENDSVFLYKNK